ncbi:MAG TPA: helix-turn-helix domain-containing protein [Polyangiaceae bacterium]|jgi:hypothetical protein
MSVPIKPLDLLRAVRDRHDLNGIQKATLAALILRSDEDGVSYPAYATLAADTGFGTRSVQRAVTCLRDARFIEVESRKVGGRLERDSNRYTIRLDALLGVVTSHHVVSDGRDVVPAGQGGGAPLAPRVVPDSHGGGVSVAKDLPIELPLGTALGEGRFALAPTGPTRKSRRVPETSAPASDATDAEIRAWCERWKVPLPEDDRVAAAFLDHARARGRRYCDWTAAWRGWKNREPQFASARPATAKADVQQAPPAGRLWKVGAAS